MPKNRIKVEIITQRKILDVVPGYFRGIPDRVEVDVCMKCAAIVFDPITHDAWHRTQEDK